MPIRRRSTAMSPARSRETSRPNSATRPRVGRSERDRSFKRLVLPAPEGPGGDWNEPGGDAKAPVLQHLGAGAVAEVDLFQTDQTGLRRIASQGGWGAGSGRCEPRV